MRLDEPVTRIKQVSETRASALAKLSIFTVRDLVTHFPHRYLDLTKIANIGQARSGDTYTIAADVHNIEEKEPKPGLKLIEITLVDDTGTLIVTMFRQPWLKRMIKAGYKIAVSGKVEFKFGFKRMTNPNIDLLSNGKDINEIAKIVPIHGATANLSAAWIRRIIKHALAYIQGIDGFVPAELEQKYKLMNYYDALCKIHFPDDMHEVSLARRTLKYTEVFLLQCLMMKNTIERCNGREAIAHNIAGPRLVELFERLPFELTNNQNAAFSEISIRMSELKAMNHLIFGDVGTGKTVLAALAIAIAIDSGHQAMFMAPTEILINQHAKTLKQFGLEFDVLTGSTKNKDDVVAKFKSGETKVLLGTHALLEDKVQAKSLSLVIIDEQHRFGVDQRTKLLAKSHPLACDALYLTATPIPRSLALAIYGDLSFSFLKEAPVGKINRTTRVLFRDNSESAYDCAFDALERGEQVFVVCPLVGVRIDPDIEYRYMSIEDEYDNVKAAITHASILQNKVFTNYRVELIHGKMSAKDKARIMAEFENGDVDVLVSTTVIEVGIDIPNATVMIIEDADRFGLAQLHQLRGRVGRTGKPSNVFLISNSKKDAAMERLRAMEKTSDGVALAEQDLALRKEGDILGSRQHGAGILSLINVERDKAIIETAHNDAANIVDGDPNFLSLRMLSYEVSRVFDASRIKHGG